MQTVLLQLQLQPTTSRNALVWRPREAADLVQALRRLQQRLRVRHMHDVMLLLLRVLVLRVLLLRVLKAGRHSTTRRCVRLPPPPAPAVALAGDGSSP
jgi:hypothetical protein